MVEVNYRKWRPIRYLGLCLIPVLALEIGLSNPAQAEYPTYTADENRAGFRITGASLASQSPDYSITIPRGEIPKSRDPAEKVLTGAAVGAGAGALATLIGCVLVSAASSSISPSCSDVMELAPQLIAEGAAIGAALATTEVILTEAGNPDRLTEDEFPKLKENRPVPFSYR